MSVTHCQVAVLAAVIDTGQAQDVKVQCSHIIATLRPLYWRESGVFRLVLFHT